MRPCFFMQTYVPAIVSFLYTQSFGQVDGLGLMLSINLRKNVFPSLNE